MQLRTFREKKKQTSGYINQDHRWRMCNTDPKKAAAIFTMLEQVLEQVLETKVWKKVRGITDIDNCRLKATYTFTKDIVDMPYPGKQNKQEERNDREISATLLRRTEEVAKVQGIGEKKKLKSAIREIFDEKIFFLHIQFTRFQTKNVQSPGTYISERTWDPSQKAIIK